MADEPLTSKDLRIKELGEENARWRRKLRTEEEKVKALTAERDGLNEKVSGFEDAKTKAVDKAVQDATSKLVKERDDLKGQIEATPDQWREKYTQLEGANRVRGHKEAFAKAAEAAGMNAAAIEDAWDIAVSKHEYKAESDTPDPAAIKGTVGAVLKARPYLLTPKGDPSGPGSGSQGDAPGGQNRGSLSALPPGPGIGRGTSDTQRPTTLAAQVDRDFAATGRTSAGKI